LLEGFVFPRKCSLQTTRSQNSATTDSEKSGYFKLFEDSDESGEVLGKRIPLDDLDPREIAQARGGSVVGSKSTSEGTKISFACRMNHRFSVYLEDSKARKDWCAVCRSLFERAGDFALRNEGQLLTPELQPSMRFSCKAGHVWSVSYKKCTRSWCKLCKKERKRLVKNILAEENIR